MANLIDFQFRPSRQKLLTCDQLLIEGVCGRDKSSGVWDFRRNYTSCCWSGRRFFGGGGARVFVVATILSARLCGQVNTKRKLRRNLENGPVDRTSVGRRAFGIRQVLGGGSPGGQAASLGRGAGGGGATARLRKLAQLFGFSPPVTYF